MGEKTVRFSDLSGQQAENPENLAIMVVTDHPDLEHPVRLEAMPQELDQLGKLSIAGVGLEVRLPGDEEPTRYILTVNNFNKLAINRPMAEVLADAKPSIVVKRRNHNRTVSGEPLRDYNTPDYAGLPHKGKIGEKEASFVRENLELVNERRIAAGQPPIDPLNPADAKRYGLETPDMDSGVTE